MITRWPLRLDLLEREAAEGSRYLRGGRGISVNSATIEGSVNVLDQNASVAHPGSGARHLLSRGADESSGANTATRHPASRARS